MSHRLSLALSCSLLLGTVAPLGCGDDDDDDTPGPDAGPDASSDGGADAGDDDPLVVQTGAGRVRGTDANGVRAFLGIPYAAPPVGERRWQRPVAPEPWDDVRDATARAPSCTQTEMFGTDILEGSSEDCLSLNVWTPPDADGTLPVLVSIHGGGFTTGSGGDGIYDGVTMVSTHDVVLVTINYRLGPLGFLAFPGLGDGKGSYGLFDQRFALEWVRDNVAAFGGDPDEVTIFGESAGGISVCMHLVSPESEGLFARAIMESGSCAIPLTNVAGAEAVGARLATAVGCDDDANPLACLAGTDAETLVSALTVEETTSFLDSFLWFPPVDGAFVAEQPQALFEAGDFASVPVLLGTNTDEGTLFARLGFPNIDEEEYAALIAENVGADADAVLARYSVEEYGTTEAALSALLRDVVFACPTRRVARALDGAGQPVWLYSFGYGIEFPILPGLGAFHGSELPFVFTNGLYGIELSEEELALSVAMQDLWVSFATTSDPNDAASPVWPAWTAADRRHVNLDLPLPFTDGVDLLAEQCDFWDTVVLVR